MFDSLEAGEGSAGGIHDLAQQLGPDLEESILTFVIHGFERWASLGYRRNGDHENDFTAALVGCLRDIRREQNLPYLALREHVYDSPEILSGEADPATAVRIDITVWWSVLSDDSFYSVECKRLALGRLCSDYVAHGMMRYASSRYAPDKRLAGMAAYIVDDDVPNLVSKVNEHVVSTAQLGAGGQLRNREAIAGLATVYYSQHKRDGALPEIGLTHLWFDVRQRPPLGSTVSATDAC